MTRHLPGASAAAFVVAGLGGVAFVASLAVGIAAYGRWFAAVPGPWSADAGVPAIAVNLALFSGFALHHSIFARTKMRRWVASRVSPALERAVYVWIASGLFVAVCWVWQPVPGTAWQVGPPGSLLFMAVQLAGVGLSIQGARQLDLLDLAGLRQAAGQAARRGPGLVDRGLYGVVRHPIYFGWVLMVWPAAMMTGSRLTFAAVSTAYLLMAIPAEERTLRRTFGPDYDAYADRVRWRIVPYVY